MMLIYERQLAGIQGGILEGWPEELVKKIVVGLGVLTPSPFRALGRWGERGGGFMLSPVFSDSYVPFLFQNLHPGTI